MSLAARMAATTVRLLERSGGRCTVKRTTNGPPDGTTGVPTSAPVISTAASFAIDTNIDASDQWKLPAGEYKHVRKLFMAAKGMAFTPAPGDELIGWEGTDWAIAPKGVMPFVLDGVTPVFYEVWITR